MTNQEILERNIEWFIYRKNPKAVRATSVPASGCAYFTNGRQCGVGCLMPSDKARELEVYCGIQTRSGICERVIFDKFMELMGGEISENQKEFLEEIQSAHDDAAAPIGFCKSLLNNWQTMVNLNGHRFNVTMPTIYEVT